MPPLPLGSNFGQSLTPRYGVMSFGIGKTISSNQATQRSSTSLRAESKRY